MKARLAELARLTQGWDGNNALPIRDGACNNLLAVLLSCQDDDIE